MESGLSPKNREFLILGTLLVLGLFTRFFGIGYQSIWIDEGSTFYYSRFTFSELMSIIEPNSPVYHAMEGFFIMLFGQTEFGLRFISALAGALTVPLAYVLSMKLFGNRSVAIVTSVLFLISPICLFYGQEARGYMLVFLLFMLQILVLLNALETRKNLMWILFAIISAVQFAMQYSGIIATFTLYLYVLYRSCRDARTKDYGSLVQMIWSGLLFLAVISPLLVKYYQDSTSPTLGHEQWSWCFVGIEYAINQLNDFLFGFILSAILFVLAMAGFYICCRKDREKAILLGIIMFFPLVFSTVYSFTTNMSPRYVLWSAVGFYMVIPLILTRFDPGVLMTKKAVIAVSAVLIVMAAAVMPVYYTEVTKEDFRAGAYALSDNVQPGDLVLYAVASENSVYGSFSFYYDPVKDGIETKGINSKEELWSYCDSGAYTNVYVLILADYDPADYLLHVESPNCEHICEAYRMNVFRITGPLPH